MLFKSRSPSFNTVRPVCILSISSTTRHFVCLFVFFSSSLRFRALPPLTINSRWVSRCGFRPHRHTVPVSDLFHFQVRAASWKLPHGGFTLARVAFKGRRREREMWRRLLHEWATGNLWAAADQSATFYGPAVSSQEFLSVSLHIGAWMISRRETSALSAARPDKWRL